MKTKIVYVLVSDITDFYLEQALISIFSLRYYNPNAYVEVVVDDATYSSLFTNNRNIKEYVNNIVSVSVPPKYNKLQSSRYLKTNLRNLIDDDFLFIDTDTVICSSLDTIDDLECEIGSVLDFHGEAYKDDALVWDYGNIEKMGWADCIQTSRFNSGVMYVKDTPKTHEFYKDWFYYWTKCYDNDIFIDQLSLRKTNYCHGLIKEIPGEWNCQISVERGKKLLSVARIVHYYNTSDIFYPFNDLRIWIKMKRNGHLPEELASLLHNPRMAFLEEYKIIGNKEIQFLGSELFRVYESAPCYFHFLLFISRIYMNIKTKLWMVFNHHKNIQNG